MFASFYGPGSRLLFISAALTNQLDWVGKGYHQTGRRTNQITTSAQDTENWFKLLTQKRESP
jgi:hypothetical protein